MSAPMATDEHDVIVVGGGPAGSTTAAFLARAGHRVLLFEREPFPRFHVGESLLPATLPILERMGVLSAIAAHGFQLKYGAMFHDQEGDYEHTFYFLTNKPWPSHSYQVHRADFDALLLDHAAKQGAEVRQRVSVESFALDSGVAVAILAGLDGDLHHVALTAIDAAGTGQVDAVQHQHHPQVIDEGLGPAGTRRVVAGE